MRPVPTISLLLLLLPAPLPAQEIRGRVLDDASGRGVNAVAITLLESGKAVGSEVLSDTVGLFSIAAPRAGIYKLRAALIGYTDLETRQFEVKSEERLELELRISVSAIALQPLRVTARSIVQNPYLARTGFYDRQKVGVGHFLTRADLEKHHSAVLSDILRNVPGIRLVRTDRTARRFEIAFGRGGGPRCLPALIIDGVMARPGGPPEIANIPLDNMVRPRDIEAVELYHGPSQLPIAYNREAVCGTIAIWTKRRT